MKFSDKSVCVLGTNNLLTYKLVQNLAGCGFHVHLFSYDKKIIFTNTNITTHTLYNQNKLSYTLKNCNYIVNLLLAPTPENYSNFSHNVQISKQAIRLASLHPVFINILPLCINHNFLSVSSVFNDMNNMMATHLKRYNQVYIGNVLSNQDSLLADLIYLKQNSAYTLNNSHPISIIDADDLITSLITIINNNYTGKVFDLANETQLNINFLQTKIPKNNSTLAEYNKSITHLKFLNMIKGLELKFLSKNYLKVLKYSKPVSTNNMVLKNLGIKANNLDVIIHKYTSKNS